MGLAMSCSFLFPFFLFTHFILFLFCLVPGFPLVSSSLLPGNDTDLLALLAFKAAITTSPFGNLNSWNESTHFCQWVGVTCGRRHHQRVTVLKLDHQNLTGPISPHVGNLSFLRELQLQDNSMTQNIPSELSHLRRLEILWLANNSLTGEIPANISSCSNLVVLDLSGNMLEGEIPAELGSLTKLEIFGIGRNNLAGGLPSTLGNLSSLTQIYTAYNSLTGKIPDALGRLRKLEFLDSGQNKLFGSIPSSVFNLSSIATFSVGSNRIHGSLPSTLGDTLPNLRFLELSDNMFTGSIPDSISNATSLFHIGFSINKFTGKVPPLEKLHSLFRLIISLNHLGDGEAGDLNFLNSLTNATNLNRLNLHTNNFGGLLPIAISNFSSEIGTLQMGRNKIVGSIPVGIGNLVNLQYLDFSTNHLTGNILAELGKLQKLHYLSLANNSFHGDIPSSFDNLTQLTILKLSGNNLRGSIPSSLMNCQMLVELRLDRNNLIGTIPREVTSLSSLLYLNISQNNLTGSLPVEIGNLKNLEELDVSDNVLSGKLPSSLGSCVKLRLLVMKSNKFLGILPPPLSNLKGMEEFDVSHNNFSGEIPNYLGGFVFLRKLNLSFNDFEGVVPERGIFRNSTAFSVEGNNKLCDGILELKLHNCNSKELRRNGLTETNKILLSITFPILGLLMLSCFIYLYCFRKKTEVTSTAYFGNSFVQLSYQSLLKATNGFSQANLIGVGSFGSVYKGTLERDGKFIAVKVLNIQCRGASKSFIAECKALKSIKHRNLVKVLTACSSVDYNGNDFKALVYEFMANGSLEEWLHPNEKDKEEHEKSRSLNILQRLNISIDVAFALDYLHHHCEKPIVHCDLKPSNILLDDDMIGHVGDFGLAKFIPQVTHDSSTNQSSSVGIRGSVGYAAPEYGMGNEVSTSGDIYSYGVLLLEMFTGKRPTDKMFDDNMSLHNFAKMAWPEQVASIVDPSLFHEREEGEASSSINNSQIQIFARSHQTNKCLISLLKVGISCSEELPRDRMSINDVVTQLHVIRNTLRG